MDINKFYEPHKLKRNKFKIFKSKFINFAILFLKIMLYPIIILVFIGLLKEIGILLQLANNNVVSIFANFFLTFANFVYANLAFIFFIATLIGLNKDIKIIIIGIFAFIVFIVLQNSLIQFDYLEGEKYISSLLFFYKNYNLSKIITNNLGLQSVNISVFGGIILGVILTYVYYKFKNVRLYKPFRYLSGFWCVLFIALLLFVILAVLFMLLWIGANEIIGWVVAYGFAWHNNLWGFALVGFTKVFFLPFGFKEVVDNYLNPNINANSLSYERFIQNFKLIAEKYGWEYLQKRNMWNNEIINGLWQYLENNKWKGKMYVWDIITALPYKHLPTQNGNLSLVNWFINSDIATYKLLKSANNYILNISTALSLGSVLYFTVNKDEKYAKRTFIITISIITVLTGDVLPIQYLAFFYAPVIYFAVYIPIFMLDSVFVAMLHLNLSSLNSQGLIDLIIVVIKYGVKTHFYWVFLFFLVWPSVMWFPFYWYIKKFKVPVIGTFETILPRIGWKTYHELWNH